MSHRIMNAGAREANAVDVDLVRALSDQARDTRKPGQTLQSRLNELLSQPEWYPHQ